MIRSKTLPEKDDFKGFDSILQIGPRFLPYGVEVRVPKCPFDENHKKN